MYPASFEYFAGAGTLAHEGAAFAFCCDDFRARFATRKRFPDMDEIVVRWPDEFLRAAPVDEERTAICALTRRQAAVPA